MSRIHKVTLIEPRPPGYHVFSHFPMPRLGLPILGAMLKQRGIDVRIYCQDFADIDYDDVLSSDLVGISTTTSTSTEAYRIARQVKQAGIPVMMGGSHVTFLADEALESADFCVRGEGEHTLIDLVDAIESGGGYSGIAGLSYRLGDEKRHNPDRPLIQDLDALPFADLSLIEDFEKVRLTPMVTSRGCPFDCNFCSVTQLFGRDYRERSVDSVIEELKQLDPKMVFFYDDNFTADKNRTKQLLDRMLSEGINISWTAQSRVDVVKDKELVQLMKRSGCHVLYIGLESVNPETLKEFNKRQSQEEISNALQTLNENGILVHGMFVFGAEHDDVNSLRRTVDYALSHKIDTLQFMVLTPLPGTTYYYEMEQHGRLLTKEWHLYDGQHVVYQPAKMSPYELQIETFRAMKRFYNLRECVRMLTGLDFLKFLAKLNLNLLLGRWQNARWQVEARVRKWLYHAYGHFLIRRFEAANKDFGERIKALADKTRIMSSSKQPAPENVDNV